MIWLVLTILWLYNLLIITFALAFERDVVGDSNSLLPNKSTTQNRAIRFSLVIPFRDEAHNLPSLLEHLKHLDYPAQCLEIILVNDNSTDGSLKIIEDFIAHNKRLAMRCIPNERLSGSPKKDAITMAINLASFDWIVTTDADCSFNQNWLSILSQHITHYAPKMVAGPVRIEQVDSPSFLNAFEQLDFLSLMGTTIGSFGMGCPFLCNGAHLAYDKNAFKEVAGFDENDHIASGDDHFLLEKFVHRFPKQVHYLKSQQAIVTTRAQKKWASFISQRVRWAAKSTGYTYWFSKLVGVVVLLSNILISCVIIHTLFKLFYTVYMDIPYSFITTLSQSLLAMSVVLKFIVDFWLIYKTAHFMQRKRYLKWYVGVSLWYPFMSCFIAFKALTTDFTWKGRRYRR